MINNGAEIERWKKPRYTYDASLSGSKCGGGYKVFVTFWNIDLFEKHARAVYLLNEYRISRNKYAPIL